MGRPIASRFPFYYGWVIVAVTFVSMIVAYGIWWSFPVFYIAILDEFGWSRAATAGIFTAGSVVYGIGSFVSGMLVDKFGARRVLPAAALILTAGCVISSVSNQIWHFLIAYGLFMGFGTISAGFVPTSVVVSNWFVEKRGTALGIALVGNGLAPLLAVFTQRLISDFGWRSAYLVLAVVPLLTIVPLASVFIRTRPRDIGIKPGGHQDGIERAVEKKQRQVSYRLEVVDRKWAEANWTLLKSFRTSRFWLLLGMMVNMGFGMGIVWTHQVAFAVGLGYSQAVAAFIFGLSGGMAAAGRLAALLSDRIGREVTMTISAVLSALGILALLGITFNNQSWLLYFYAVIFGVGLGLNAPVYSATAADLFSGRGYGSILGFINIGWGIGSGLGAWFGGAVYDRTGDYRLAIATAIVVFLLMSLFCWLAAPRKVRRVTRVKPGNAGVPED